MTPPCAEAVTVLSGLAKGASVDHYKTVQQQTTHGAANSAVLGISTMALQDLATTGPDLDLTTQQHTACSISLTGHLRLLLQDEFDDRRRYIKPKPTGATEGHALGAQRTMAAVESANSSSSSKQWKMQRFEKNAKSKIVRYMHSNSSSQAGHEQQQPEQAAMAEYDQLQQEQDC